MIDIPEDIMRLSLPELWVNYQEAMDVLVMMANAGVSDGADYYAAVARVSIDVYFQEVERCLQESS